MEGGQNWTKLPDETRWEMMRYLVAWAARLARRDSLPAGAMLERLNWARPSVRWVRLDHVSSNAVSPF